jgi:ATP-dependent DNA ligase
MQKPSTPAAVAGLRPMPFGRRASREVLDGIWEPLWGGERVVVEITGTSVRILDEEGDPLDGFDLLRDALLAAALSDDLVVDGYLLPAPLRTTTDPDAEIGGVAAMTPNRMARQMLVGGGGGDGSRRGQRETARARPPLLSPSSPTAFVAVDLLRLDGQPLLDIPLAERKRLLDGVVVDTEVVRRTISVRAPVEAWFTQWRAFGFREVAVKGANSRYTPGVPNPDWAKARIPTR